MGKLKFPANPPPFPPEFYPLIGIIALAWGMYDVLFNRLLAALLDATGDTTEPRWRTANYRRRRGLCHKNIRTYFSAEPRLKNYLETLLDESADIHNKRNAIIHGTIACQLLPTSPPQVCLVTEAKHNGRSVVMTFTADELESIGYDIMHLNGRLNLTFQNPVQGLSSSDISSLQALLSRSPHILPTPSSPPKRPTPPGSSPR